MGRALTGEGPGEPMNDEEHSRGGRQSRCESVFVPQVGVHAVEGGRQAAAAAVTGHLHLLQALPLTTQESSRSIKPEGEVRLPVDAQSSHSLKPGRRLRGA